MIAPARTPSSIGSPAGRSPRLLIPSLGAALLVLVVLGDITGIPYLLVRSGTGSPLRLDIVDGAHVYLGLVALAVVAAKVWRIGTRHAVSGVALPQLWHRWVSASLGVAYGAVFISGALLLPRWPANVRTALVNVHLLTAVWAAVPTAWHAWHYRRLLMPLLGGRIAGSGGTRWLVGSAVILAGGLLPVLAPRALAPSTQAGAGKTWVASGPREFVDRMEISPDARWIVAAGSGLYVRARLSQQWDTVAGFTPADPVLALPLTTGVIAAYVGTGRALYASADIHGPYQRLPFPGHEIHGIATDPSDPAILWAGSRDGFFRSADAGQHWTRAVDGLAQPTDAWAVTYFRGAVFASDSDAVYRWAGGRWETSNHQRFVVTFDATPDGRLLASSMGDGIRAYDGHTWTDASAGLPRHGHDSTNGTTHVVSVTAVADAPAYAATMLEGVAVSDDSSRSWASTWPGLREDGTIWRVLPVDGQLVAATDRGILSYPLPAVESAGIVWWSLLVACAGLGAGAVLAVAATRRAPRRRASSSPEH